MASPCPTWTELRPPTPPLDVPSSAGGEDRVQQNEKSLQIADCDQQHLGQWKGSCLRPHNLRSGKSVGGIANRHAPNTRHAATSAFGDPRAGRRLRRWAPSVCRSAATTTAPAKLLAHPGMGPVRDIVVRVARSFHDASTAGGGEADRKASRKPEKRVRDPERAGHEACCSPSHVQSHARPRALFDQPPRPRIGRMAADRRERTSRGRGRCAHRRRSRRPQRAARHSLRRGARHRRRGPSPGRVRLRARRARAVRSPERRPQRDVPPPRI